MDKFENLRRANDGASLDESRALNKMLIDALDQERADRRKTRRVSMICTTICLVAILLFAGLVGVVASGVEITRTTDTITRTTDTITQDTGEGSGDAVYQAGENARFYAGGAE